MRLADLLKLGTAILMAFGSIAGEPQNRTVLADFSTYHVAPLGSDITGLRMEAKPFATIQHGIDSASYGDTVLVHPGVYTENINFKAKNILVGSLFVTTGNEEYISQTVINGNRAGHVVTFPSGETTAAVLSGFTITNGYAFGEPPLESSAGGISCHESSPILTNLVVTGNEAVDEGGGMFFDDCAPTIRDVLIANNLSNGGGGIRYTYSSIKLENAVIAYNRATGGGAGIQFYHSEGTVTNTLITGNTGSAKGGGMQFDGCSPTFTHVTVVGNWTSDHGGGMNVSYMSQPTLVNSIVWGNSPEQIYFDPQWSGEAITVEYSDIQGGAAGIITNGLGPVFWGSGNLDTSPRFVDTGLGNFHLANDSPLIGAGTAAGAPPTDAEGNPRPHPAGSTPDMGAYENPLGLKYYLPMIDIVI